MSVNESLVVSGPEAAALLGVSEGLIYQLLERGLLPRVTPLVTASVDPAPRGR